VTALHCTTHAPAALDHEAVLFTPPQSLHRCSNDDLIGQSDINTGEILSRLAADDELQLQLTLYTSRIGAESGARPVTASSRFLEITIYGPRSRLSDVGDFVTRCCCYLDDPYECDRNVPYMNPQCLFTIHERPQMTYDLCRHQHQALTDFAQSSSDVLKDFETTDRFEEAADPAALLTTLQAYVYAVSREGFAKIEPYRHQRQALTFFRKREKGLHPTRDDIDIWPRRTIGDKTLYNQTTLVVQSIH
jgi:hypothetical protein